MMRVHSKPAPFLSASRTSVLIERFAERVVAWPRTVLGLVFICTMLLVSGTMRLQLDADTRTFVSGQSAPAQSLKVLEDNFGPSHLVVFIVTARSGNIFSPEALRAIQDLTDRAWFMPYATGVLSLATVSTAPLDGQTMADPDVVNWLVSEDGALATVVVQVQAPHQDSAEGPAIAAFSRRLQAEFQTSHPAVEVRLTGDKIADAAFAEAARRDLSTLAPLMAGLGFLALVLGLRSWQAAMIALAVMTGSVLITLGVAGWLGVTINAATAAAPAIILTLAAAACIHLISLARERYKDGATHLQAIKESLRFNMVAIFMTTFTDVIGFVVLNLGLSPPLRDLGNLVSVGVVVAFVLSVTFVPAMLVLIPTAMTGRQWHVPQWLLNLNRWLILKRRWCATLFALLGLLAALGISRISYEDDFVRYFDKSYAFRQDTEYLEQHLTALQIVDFALPAAGPDRVAEPLYLNQVEAFANWLRTQPEVRHVQSVNDLIKRLNRSVHDDNPAYATLPQDRQATAQLLLLYELSAKPGLSLATIMNGDRSKTKLTALLRPLPSSELRAFATRAEAWLRVDTPEIATAASGLYLTYANTAQANAQAMVGGTLIALALIAVTMLVVLRSWRLAALSLIPNLAPAIITLGLWGWLAGDVNLAVSVVVAISFGIIVDDTTHLFARFSHLRRAGVPAEAALYETMNSVGQAIFLTTGMLVVGFLVLATSSFAVSAQMGVLTAMTIVIAMLAELCLTPALLLWQKERT